MSDEHIHKWDVWITDDLIREDGVISKSPCSTADDILAVNVIQLQGCKCGARRRAVVGYEKERFRGDDWRRARGLAPLGNLPGSYG
jgi:hypothetical protein